MMKAQTAIRMKMGRQPTTGIISMVKSAPIGGETLPIKPIYPEYFPRISGRKYSGNAAYEPGIVAPNPIPMMKRVTIKNCMLGANAATTVASVKIMMLIKRAFLRPKRSPRKPDKNEPIR